MKHETKILIFLIALAVAAAFYTIQDRAESSSVESFPDHSEIHTINN
jgi:hypothetical protein